MNIGARSYFYIFSHRVNSLGKGMKPPSPSYVLNNAADWALLLSGGNQSSRKITMNSKPARRGLITVRLSFPKHISGMVAVNVVLL